jgi:hypothetical protein
MRAVVNRRVLDGLLDPVGECLTPAVASRIAALRADPRLQHRIDELAGKNSQGALTRREEAEYEAYVEALDLIAILQATARKTLNATRPASRR